MPTLSPCPGRGFDNYEDAERAIDECCHFPSVAYYMIEERYTTPDHGRFLSAHYRITAHNDAGEHLGYVHCPEAFP